MMSFRSLGLKVLRAKLEKNCSLFPLVDLLLARASELQNVFEVLSAKTILLELTNLHPLIVVAVVVSFT